MALILISMHIHSLKIQFGGVYKSGRHKEFLIIPMSDMLLIYYYIRKRRCSSNSDSKSNFYDWFGRLHDLSSQSRYTITLLMDCQGRSTPFQLKRKIIAHISFSE